MKSIFKSASTNCHEPDSGCCGMAGSFGYETEHYEVSKKISELVLVPEINKTDKNTLVVANGFSCRHQIHDFAGSKAVHWVESVDFVMEWFCDFMILWSVMGVHGKHLLGDRAALILVFIYTFT